MGVPNKSGMNTVPLARGSAAAATSTSLATALHRAAPGGQSPWVLQPKLQTVWVPVLAVLRRHLTPHRGRRKVYDQFLVR